MSFLAPLFLLSGLALALPVILHLIRQTTRERTPFSSLLLLSPTPPRLTRRSRLNHVLLLILRCSVLVLLAFGFARPFLSRPVNEAPAKHGPARILLLLDTSASMRRAGLWAQAKDRAIARVRKAAPGDAVAIYTYDRDLKPVLSFEEWTEMSAGQRAAVAEERIARLSPGWTGSRAGIALTRGAELLADNSGRQVAKELVLISDMQEGSRLESIQGYQWPPGLRLSVEPLKLARLNNASLQLVAEAPAADTKESQPIRLRVANAPDSSREQFKAGWVASQSGGFLGAPVEVYVPAGQSRTVSIPLPEAGTPGPTRIVLTGDDDEFDNTVFVVRPEPVHLAIAYFGREAGDEPKTPLYFLKRAFPETSRQQTRVLAFDTRGPVEVKALEGASLIVATHLAQEVVSSLRSAIESGKTLLVSLTDAGVAPALAGLLDVPEVRIAEAKPSKFAMLSEIDYRHPLFSPFADPRFADFTKIRFWRYQRLETTQFPGARVLARFDTGDPALLETALGKGRIFILAAGWQPEESQLALSTKFVPLVYTLLEQSGAPSAPPPQYVAGDVVPMLEEAAHAGGTISISGSDGIPHGLPAGQTNVASSLEPGVYTVAVGGKPSMFAVNLDPAESRPGRVQVEDLEKLGAPVLAGPVLTDAQQASRQLRLKSAELENRQKLWRWLILAAVSVLFVETWLSGRTARRILVEGVKG